MTKNSQDTNFVALTEDGLLELKSELSELKDKKLPSVIERVALAREQGDLSENADYQSARDEQAIVQARIDEIEEIISKAKIVKQATGSKIGMGSAVKLHHKGDSKKKMTFNIVGEFESNPEEGKISSVSPLGKALMGKNKGDAVKVKAPMGEIEYVVEEIN